MKIEIRADNVRISGYVNAVERDSRVLPKTMAHNAKTNFVEKIKAKTFERALETANDVEIRYNHRKTLGSIKSGHIKLYEDNIGLYADVTTNDPDVIQKAKNNELRGWSFGFISKHDDWEYVSDNLQRRNVDDIELREVSILSVTPAYIGTSIELRDDDCQIIETRGQHEKAETFLLEEKKENSNNNNYLKIEILKMRG